MPGQKSIRLAKKGSGPSFLDAGFHRLQLGHPFPPASLCGKERGGIGKDCSRPFLASAPALLPGQREGRSKRPTKLEMIHNLKLSPFTLSLSKGKLRIFARSSGTPFFVLGVYWEHDYGSREFEHNLSGLFGGLFRGDSEDFWCRRPYFLS